MKLVNINIDNSPANYLPSEALVRAAEIAYALKRPLLLSGEPGTGKTDFAHWVAQELAKDGFASRALVFPTKSTSTAQDLFYYYDAISHFREATIQQKTSGITGIRPRDYISLNALGKAFFEAKGISLSDLQSSNDDSVLSPVNESEMQARPDDLLSSKRVRFTGHVVLIDEIDKAPRDFPNDLLNEIEKYSFQMKELQNEPIELSEKEREKVFIIMTSNFEKNLPEAFLRRCVYFHITFPTAEQLKAIVVKRLGITNDKDLENLQNRVSDFFKFRDDDNIQKKPTTSEFLDYARTLYEEKMLGVSLFQDNEKVSDSSLAYLSLLLKKKEDRDLYMPEPAK